MCAEVCSPRLSGELASSHFTSAFRRFSSLYQTVNNNTGVLWRRILRGTRVCACHHRQQNLGGKSALLFEGIAVCLVDLIFMFDFGMVFGKRLIAVVLDTHGELFSGCLSPLQYIVFSGGGSGGGGGQDQAGFPDV